MLPAGPELVLIVGVIVLLFGANRIPKLARALGKSKGELEKSYKQAQQEQHEEEL